MNNLASDFDKPIDSREHKLLAETAWMGGPFVTIPYWLGRLIGRNLFREEQEVVKAELQRYFLAQGWNESLNLVDRIDSWDSIALVLQGHIEGLSAATKTHQQKVQAIEALLKTPTTTNQEIAAMLNTTEKQIARITLLHCLRRLLEDANHD